MVSLRLDQTLSRSPCVWCNICCFYYLAFVSLANVYKGFAILFLAEANIVVSFVLWLWLSKFFVVFYNVDRYFEFLNVLCEFNT